MSEKYSIFFENTQDILLDTLVKVYLEYYKIKKEYIENKDIFIKELLLSSKVEEKIPSVQKEEEKEKGKENNNEKETRKEDTMNTIYHKLIIQTHPDKGKYKNSILYEHTKDGYEKKKFPKLCFLARFLNIPIDLLREDEIKEIEETIEKKKQKIRQYEKTYPITYSRSSNEVKEKILSSFKESL